MKLVVRQAERSDVFGDLVRVHFSHRPGIGAGNICRIEANGRRIRAVARNTLRNEKGVILLDNVMREKLGLSDNATAEFAITPGNTWDDFWWAWGASNPVNRIAARLAALSVALGLIGGLLGVISIVVSLK